MVSAKHDPNLSVSRTDSEIGRAKLKWTFKLQPNPRGIGWNWQVKNVPTIDDAVLPKWQFVLKRLMVASYYFGQAFALSSNEDLG